MKFAVVLLLLALGAMASPNPSDAPSKENQLTDPFKVVEWLNNVMKGAEKEVNKVVNDVQGVTQEHCVHVCTEAASTQGPAARLVATLCDKLCKATLAELKANELK